MEERKAFQQQWSPPTSCPLPDPGSLTWEAADVPVCQNSPSAPLEGTPGLAPAAMCGSTLVSPSWGVKGAQGPYLHPWVPGSVS